MLTSVKQIAAPYRLTIMLLRLCWLLYINSYTITMPKNEKESSWWLLKTLPGCWAVSRHRNRHMLRASIPLGGPDERKENQPSTSNNVKHKWNQNTPPRGIYPFNPALPGKWTQPTIATLTWGFICKRCFY